MTKTQQRKLLRLVKAVLVARRNRKPKQESRCLDRLTAYCGEIGCDPQAAVKGSALYARMIVWLDAEEGRTLTLCSGNADFEGPEHMIEFSTVDRPPQNVSGETREDCFSRIEEITAGAPPPDEPRPRTMREHF